MQPVDFRNTTFASLQAKLAGQRAEVLSTWHRFGPGTTAEVCAKSQFSILTFRPRTTELFQLGFIRLDGTPQSALRTPKSHEGVYRARTTEEHRAWLAEQQIDARPGQRLLTLG